MSQKLSEIKKLMVRLGADSVIANLSSSFSTSFLKRLVPGPLYYDYDMSRTITREGVKFRIYPRDLSQWIIFSNQRDGHVEAALKVLNPVTTGMILDVGANCGQFSLVLACRIYDQKLQKSVIGFEPNPRIYENLTVNLSLNPQLRNVVKVLRVGLGERSDVLQMQIPNRNTGAGSLVRNYEGEPHESYEIAIKTIDELFYTSDTPIEFIKIDVEDFESFVIQGAHRVLTKFKPALYFEVGSGQLHQRDIFSFLSSLGYNFYKETVRKWSKQVIDLDNFRPIEKLNNILALHSDSQDLKKF